MKHLSTLKDAQTIPNVCMHALWKFLSGCIMNRKSIRSALEAENVPFKAFDTGLMTGDG